MKYFRGTLQRLAGIEASLRARTPFQAHRCVGVVGKGEVAPPANERAFEAWRTDAGEWFAPIPAHMEALLNRNGIPPADTDVPIPPRASHGE